VIVLLACIAVMYAAVAVSLHGVWRGVAERERDARAAEAQREERTAFWRRHEHLGAFPIDATDLREAGWSAERARTFLAESFPGRASIRLEELRPFLEDVTVCDVVSYRASRFAAAARYEPIRQTWVNVDDLERSGRLPPELHPFVCERERQSGKLIRATDLLPFVGRPVVRELLERKLADCNTPMPALR
jgi:hypothetical protein